MEGVSLKSRAVSFAFASGAVAFILAMLAVFDPEPSSAQVGRAVIAALIVGVMAWASAERNLSGLATAIDLASARIAEAAEGDLTSPTAQKIRDELPDLSRALDSMFDQVKGALDSAQTLAMFDQVTSLANRTHFRREAERMLGAAAQGTTLLAFIDLDHFKAVNDSLGHAQGDQLLAKVAGRLRGVAVEADRRIGGEAALVARLSGDEFTLLFPAIGDSDEARVIGGRLLAELTRPFDLGGQVVSVGASIGLALYPDHGTALPSLMRAADVAMYRAKAAGRGRVRIYDGAMASQLSERLKLDDQLRQAVTNGEFTFVYQPQVALSDGRIVSAEARLRWEHPTGTFRPLSTFVDAAENNGLIVDIGNWAVARIAERLSQWPATALAPRLAVSISKRQVVRPDYFDRVRAALAERGVPLSLLEFQIADAVATTCSAAAVDQLTRLRSDGALIVIDAFGAGSSNLSRLRMFPVDCIKLDARLIEPLERDPLGRDVVQALIALVHGLGATAAADGVDTQGQLDMLRVMGCDLVQGQAIAPPMLDADYAAWNAVARIRA